MTWEFFHPEKDIDKHGSKLPHWQQGEVMQFVTFRLKDALPQARLRKWKEDRTTWLRMNPKPWNERLQEEYDRRFPSKLEEWLDAGLGSCLMKRDEHRGALESALMRFHGDRVHHMAWVIMPNHVHLLFRPMMEIQDLIKAWKGVSARSIGKGSIWQENYRDTLIRSARHFSGAVKYIRANPRKAKLRPEEYTLWEGERAREV